LRADEEKGEPGRHFNLWPGDTTMKKIKLIVIGFAAFLMLAGTALGAASGKATFYVA